MCYVILVQLQPAERRTDQQNNHDRLEHFLFPFSSLSFMTGYGSGSESSLVCLLRPSGYERAQSPEQGTRTYSTVRYGFYVSQCCAVPACLCVLYCTVPLLHASVLDAWIRRRAEQVLWPVACLSFTNNLAKTRIRASDSST